MRSKPFPQERENNFESNSSLIQAEEFPFDNDYLDDWNRLGCQSSLWKLGQASLSGLPIDELYRFSRKLLMVFSEIEDCSIWELRSDGHAFSMASNVSASAFSDTATISGARQSFERKIDINIISPSWQEYYLDPRSCSAATPDAELGNSVVGVVIPGQSTPLGLIVVRAAELSSLSQDILMLVRAVAKILSNAIERHRSEFLLRTQAQILQAVATGQQLTSILMQLCQLIEAQTTGAFCSILLLDREKGQLHAGVAPSLPRAYADAFEGLVIGERVGSCGTAAYTGKSVFVEDIATDPLWEKFRDLALFHNINACWSIPFKSTKGEVLGTFALSHSHPCRPTPFHLNILESASHLASIAVQGHRTNEQLSYLANHDDLTGLVSRSQFLSHLQSTIDSQCQQKNSQENTSLAEFSVLFLDLNGFKLINDSLGHNAGDRLLQIVAQRIQGCLRKQDTLARIGGDEFAIIIKEAETVECSVKVAKRIISAVSAPFSIDNREFYTSVSVGIVQVSGQYDSAEDILRDADISMYQAKHKKNAGYVVFDSEMQLLAQYQLTLELEFRRAVEELNEQKKETQFSLVYQPIVDLKSGTIEGFEALLRWHHYELGSISPMEFIPLAESTGLIVPLGDWVVERVCQQLSIWKQHYPTSNTLKVNVNVSGKQFLMTNLWQTIEANLDRFNLDSSALRIEITESILIEVESYLHDQFDRLRQLNIPLCLDDFGTGYSSLSYLQAFPVSVLKLDRSFIQNLASNSSPIVQAVIDLAHKLRMKVVAEGIESPCQMQALLAAGCDFGQGYYFSRPVAAEDAQMMLETGNSTLPLLG
ncbi:MAG: EAL domain-containing protein [Synechococcus sp.]